MATSAADAPLTVSTDGTAGPYVVVTSEQLGLVVEALRAEGVRFQVDREAVLLDGEPALAVIDFGTGADVTRVQGVLDRVATELQRKGRRGRRAPTRKELIIRGVAAAMRELQRRLETGLHGGWERRTEVEDRFRRTLPPRTIAFCFSKLVPAVNRQVAVLMQGRGRGMSEELYLSGIVPLTGRKPLDLAQHDQVVTDFHETFVEPLARDLGVRVLDRSVSVQPSLENVLSTEAMARLRDFADTANKNILDELDFRRWAGLIGQTHLDNTVVDPDLLDAWLADEGFEASQREALIREFDSGRRLLNAYDDERRESCPQ